MSLLAINWAPDPELISLGPIHVRYYGLFFVAGFILGYQMFIKFFKKENLPLELLDTLLYTLLGCTLVGARLGHVLFYEPGYYLSHPIDILKVWEGGLASHGGTIAVLLGMWWYVRKYGKKYNFDYLWLTDRLAIACSFAAMSIRLGNLMNSEIYGYETSLPWGVIFSRAGEVVPKHPTQIYEALSYFVTGVLLLYLYKFKFEKIKRGLLLGIFFIGMFATRFCIEFIKEPQVGFEENMALNMGQILSIPFILVGIFLIVRSFVVKDSFAITPPLPPIKENRKK